MPSVTGDGYASARKPNRSAIPAFASPNSGTIA